MQIDKRTFKICEAAALGLTHYYMGPKDKRELTDDDRMLALYTIPNLPKGWMQEQYEWNVFGKSKSKRKR